MAVKLLSVNNVDNVNQVKYIVDCEEEKDLIPTEDLVFGTKCFVIETGKEYQLNSKLEWVKGV